MPSSSRPRFSVVIPAFNEAAYLGAALTSLARQDFTGAYEVVVVDNNSTDGTARIAQAHGARVVKETHPGVCHARQAGTQTCEGEIVVSTDADTRFSPSWLSTIDRAFRENPNCVAVAGPCAFTDAPWWGSIYPRILFGIVYVLSLVTRRVFYITATNIAFRKDAWQGYDTRLTQGGDELDLLRRLRKQGKVVFVRQNSTLTSARRLQRGLVYNLFVSFLFYYFLAYLLNRLTHRPLLHTAPAFRTETESLRLTRKLWLGLTLSGFAVNAAVYTLLGQSLGSSFDVTFDALRRFI